MSYSNKYQLLEDSYQLDNDWQEGYSEPTMSDLIPQEEYTCSFCKKPCYGTWVDMGYDGYEYGSISGKHTDWHFVSDCCNEELITIKSGEDDEEQSTTY